MNVKTAADALIRKNVRKPKETSDCMCRKALLKNVRNPMKIS